MSIPIAKATVLLSIGSVYQLSFPDIAFKFDLIQYTITNSDFVGIVNVIVGIILGNFVRNCGWQLTGGDILFGHHQLTLLVVQCSVIYIGNFRSEERRVGNK